MINHINLSTRRLKIHKLTMDDYDAYYDMLKMSKLRFFFRVNDNRTLGIYLEDELIGHLVLTFIDKDNLNVGYRLRTIYRHQGYMKEAVSAISDFLEDKVKNLVIVTEKDNQASIAIAMDCGYALSKIDHYYTFLRSRYEN